jgi:hypothetical protein
VQAGLQVPWKNFFAFYPLLRLPSLSFPDSNESISRMMSAVERVHKTFFGIPKPYRQQGPAILFHVPAHREDHREFLSTNRDRTARRE